MENSQQDLKRNAHAEELGTRGRRAWDRGGVGGKEQFRTCFLYSQSVKVLSK